MLKAVQSNGLTEILQRWHPIRNLAIAVRHG